MIEFSANECQLCDEEFSIFNDGSWPVDDLVGSDPKPPIAFVQYMSADGKTFYLFSSGGDCLSVARGRLP